MRITHVCAVTREYEGVAGAGGLKDAVRGLAEALAGMGVRVSVIMPYYGCIAPECASGVGAGRVDVSLWGAPRTLDVVFRQVGPVDVYLLRAPEFLNKQDVYTYTREDAPSPDDVGAGHRDGPEMNTLLQAGAAALMRGWERAPDVVHCHDAHTALLPLYLRDSAGNVEDFFAGTGVLTTIHNAGAEYQQVPGDAVRTAALTGLPEDLLARGLVDFGVNPFLIAGLYGVLNTVSPGYARELSSGDDAFSGALTAAMRREGIRIRGVYNGLDAAFWREGSGYPAHGWRLPGFKSVLREALAGDWSAGEIGGNDREGEDEKSAGQEKKGSVSGSSGLELSGAPLDAGKFWVLFHGRLSAQKGVEAVLKIGNLGKAAEDFQFIIYGRGNPGIEAAVLQKLEEESDWTFIRGYDPVFTRRIIAASSVVLVPSLWEPCGQIDMIGQLLGALPVVRAVGGLKKIKDGADGYSFVGSEGAEGSKGSKSSKGALEEEAFQKKLLQALHWEKNRGLRVQGMRRRAENSIYGRRSWRKIALQGYLPLFRRARRFTRRQTS